MHKYLILSLFFFACNLAILIFLSDASIPVTLAPNLVIGSDRSPPPHPMSNILIFCKGLFLAFNLKF